MALVQYFFFNISLIHILHQIFKLSEISPTLCTEVQNLVTPKIWTFCPQNPKIQTWKIPYLHIIVDPWIQIHKKPKRSKFENYFDYQTAISVWKFQCLMKDLLGDGLVSFGFSFSLVCTWFSGGAKVWAQIWDFQKVFTMDIWQRFWQAYVQLGDKFRCTDKFGYILSDKNYKYLLKLIIWTPVTVLRSLFGSLCLGCCVFGRLLELVSQITASSMELFFASASSTTKHFFWGTFQLLLMDEDCRVTIRSPTRPQFLCECLGNVCLEAVVTIEGKFTCQKKKNRPTGLAWFAPEVNSSRQD